MHRVAGRQIWTTENRARYDRGKLRYPSDLTDDEWALIEPRLPPAKHGGRERQKDASELVNGIMYVLTTGRHWRYIPKDLPPRGRLARIHPALYGQCREQAARGASRTAAVMDSQSVQSAEMAAPQ